MDENDIQATPKEHSKSHKAKKESGRSDARSESKSHSEHLSSISAKHTSSHGSHEGNTAQHAGSPTSHVANAEEGVDWTVWLVILAAILVIFNQVQIISLTTALGSSSGGAGGGTGIALAGNVGSGKFFEMDGMHIYGPTLLSAGESAVLPGYRTKFKLWPTISSQAIPEQSSGDQVQDAINAIVPRGIPPYGQAAGLSFDDPIASQKTMGRYDSLQLSAEEQKRWEGIVNRFTCDYCCGSPQNPTIITRCGCAHAKGWRGLAKWFVKNMPEVSDDQIFGELTKWKTLWYPGPSIQRLLQELGSGSGGGAASTSALPEMVGGC